MLKTRYNALINNCGIYFEEFRSVLNDDSTFHDELLFFDELISIHSHMYSTWRNRGPCNRYQLQRFHQKVWNITNFHEISTNQGVIHKDMALRTAQCSNHWYRWQFHIAVLVLLNWWEYHFQLNGEGSHIIKSTPSTEAYEFWNPGSITRSSHFIFITICQNLD